MPKSSLFGVARRCTVRRKMVAQHALASRRASEALLIRLHTHTIHGVCRKCVISSGVESTPYYYAP